MNPTLDRSLGETAALIRRGDITATELVSAALTQIDATDSEVGAFASVQANEARLRATELDRGTHRGPLHGIPIALKDLIFTRGVATEANCGALAGFVPDVNAAVVQRLSDAGAVILGKTNTHELAFGVSCPASRNPWDTSRMTGGSSGGSAAAVAARQVFGALGTDTGGSVRIPSSYCGTSAIKTTRGLVPRDGVHLISWTYDTVGPMARTAQDCRLLLEVIAGPSPDGPDCTSTRLVPAVEPGRLRLGLPTKEWLGAAPMADEVLTVLDAVAETLRPIVGSANTVVLPAWEEHGEVGSSIVFSEAATIHAEMIKEHRNDFSDEVGAILQAGCAIPATEIASAQDLRRRFESEWLAVFDNVDMVLCPVTPNHVPPHGIEELHGLPLIPATTQFTFAINGAGLPAISLPGGFGPDGLPVGFQLIGRPFSELTLAAVGEAFQQHTDFHQRCPRLGV